MGIINCSDGGYVGYLYVAGNITGTVADRELSNSVLSTVEAVVCTCKLSRDSKLSQEML